MNHEDFMQRAIELSEENIKAGKGGPFWAVVVKDWKIIWEWANHVTSENDPTALFDSIQLLFHIQTFFAHSQGPAYFTLSVAIFDANVRAALKSYCLW